MINPNQRVAAPFGDVYFPTTSHTDRLAQQFYVEEKQREAQEKQMQDALDNEFSKNLTGIRDIDTDDLTKAYGDFKLANKAAMRQRDGVSPKQQMELLRKKAAMYDIINKSKTQKALEDDVLGGLKKDRYAYQKDAHQILMQSRATPLSKLGNLYGYDYSNKGTNFDFQPIHKNAEGTLQTLDYTNKPLDKDGIQTERTEWKFGNTPPKYHDVLINGLQTPQAQWSAESMISQTPKEIINETQNEFSNLPLDELKRIGLISPEKFIIKPTDSLLEKYAKHNTQLYTLRAKPVMGDVKPYTNEAKKMAKEFANKKEMDAINFAQQKQLKNIELSNAKELDRSRAESKSKGDFADNLWVDNYLDRVEEEVKNQPNKGIFASIFGGNDKTIQPSNALYEYLGKPEYMGLTDDGKYVLRYKRQKIDDNGNVVGYETDPIRSGTFTRDDIKLSMGVKAVGKKELPKEMNNRTSKSKKETKQKGEFD